MKSTLLKKLIKYNRSFTPFHMPGHKRAHKRSVIPYNIDITEVEGFDNLHDMKGILKETANLAKKLFCSLEAFPLVNGSTCGVLSGIYTLTRENKNILIARNCHKSVYNAVEILELNAHYILPKAIMSGIWGKVSAHNLEEIIKSNNIGTVVITSPTYEGVISDISKIYDICKKNNAFLFIDCAHGAHLPKTHTYCDMCVMSLHKTLPSLTQTAVLNVYSSRVDINILRHGLSIFETSSPSYVLLASIDECLRYTLKNQKDFDIFYKNLEDFYKKTETLKNIKVTHFDDLGKIIIFANNGQALAKKLRKEKIEIEMASEKYALAIATVSDSKKTLKILYRALVKIDKNVSCADFNEAVTLSLPQKAMDIKTALNQKGNFVNFHDAENMVCLEYVWAYPPGSPIIVPGEIISCDVIDLLSQKNELKSTNGKFPLILAK